MAQLTHFTRSDKRSQRAKDNRPSEYIVIVMDEDLADIMEEGYEVLHTVEVDDDDVSMFPCDRPLWPS